MAERPIIFSGPMVRAILAGRKSQTRRVIRPEWSRCLDLEDEDDRERARAGCRYGVGDQLWVRETFHGGGNGGAEIVYKADYLIARDVKRWTPAIYMPRRVSRITLEVTGVRVERVQGISEEDAVAEGCTGHDPEPADEGGTVYAWRGRSSAPCPRAHFLHLWDSLNGKSTPWASNPFVWVIEFRRREQ